MGVQEKYAGSSVWFELEICPSISINMSVNPLSSLLWSDFIFPVVTEVVEYAGMGNMGQV